ncbi:MAG: response regulator [Solirubrobacteraceae bacterium]
MMPAPPSPGGTPVILPGDVTRREAATVRRAPIRVALADDSYLVRQALVSILTRSDEVALVASYSDAVSLLLSVERDRPDVVITDIRMPPSGDDEGIRLAAELRRRDPEIGVVVLSQYAEPRYALQLLGDGSDRLAYMLKERVADRNQLLNAISAVATGGSYVDPKVVEALIDARTNAKDSHISELTPRELEVLGLVAQGLSNAAIGAQLFLTKRAVEKHVGAILSKLSLPDGEDVSRRVMATLAYLSDHQGYRARR